MTVTEMNAHDERISSFLDDAMPAAERSVFESELLDNAELRQQVIELRQLRQDVATLPRYSVTEGFAQRVVAAAVAAKANENANITPATRQRPQTMRRATIGGLAIAASVAIVLGTLAWINNRGPVDIANNRPVEVNQATDNPLAPVLAALPADDQVLVVRIKSSKNVAAGTVLREALAEQGIEKRRQGDESTGGGLVRKAYKNHLIATIGNDPNKSKPAADALYVQISPDELELALSRLAQPEQRVKFVAEQQLAIASPKGSNNIIGENPAVAAEHVPGNSNPTTKAANNSDDFVQELTPSLFRLPAADVEAAVAPAVMPAPAATPKGKVRVLILIENVD
jgi:hypothetical protein